MKNYLHSEESRNKQNKAIFTDYLRRALKDPNCAVLCVHHITVTQGCEDNEIPSADTVLFDHDFARAVFGDYGWEDALCELALTHPERRELKLAEMLLDLDENDRRNRSTHTTEVA